MRWPLATKWKRKEEEVRGERSQNQKGVVMEEKGRRKRVL